MEAIMASASALRIRARLSARRPSFRHTAAGGGSLTCRRRENFHPSGLPDPSCPAGTSRLPAGAGAGRAAELPTPAAGWAALLPRPELWRGSIHESANSRANSRESTRTAVRVAAFAAAFLVRAPPHS
jgi:hypothetical protein